MDAKKNPAPAASPMAATTQIDAAVVKPVIDFPVKRIVPAPKNPTPVITAVARRAGSIRTFISFAKSLNP
ncbi:hypothetical protein D3C75_1006250 [compost metagenome]